MVRILTNPKVATYYEVTLNGAQNPFLNVQTVNDYGNNANDYHINMLSFHSMLPVINDSSKLQIQIQSIFVENKQRWTEWYKYIQALDSVEIDKGFTESESITHGGKDTTDSTSTATDSKNTFDNATLRVTGETISSGDGSLIYGHTITTSKTRWDRSPLQTVIDYGKASMNSLFADIIDTVIRGVSCHIYIPDKPSTQI